MFCLLQLLTAAFSEFSHRPSLSTRSPQTALFLKEPRHSDSLVDDMKAPALIAVHPILVTVKFKHNIKLFLRIVKHGQERSDQICAIKELFDHRGTSSLKYDLLRKFRMSIVDVDSLIYRNICN